MAKGKSKRWDGSLTDEQLEHLPQSVRQQIVKARREEIEYERIQSEALGLKRNPFNRESVYD